MLKKTESGWNTIPLRAASSPVRLSQKTGWNNSLFIRRWRVLDVGQHLLRKLGSLRYPSRSLK